MGLDPRLMVPYHDPYDMTEYQTKNFTLVDDPAPSLADLDEGGGSAEGVQAFQSYQCNSSSTFAQPIQPVAFVNNDALYYPPIQDAENFAQVLDQPVDNPMQNFQFQNAPGSQSSNVVGSLNFIFEDFVTGLTVPPEKTLPFTCLGCHIRREIFHTNGTHTIRLQLHERFQVLSHAILHAASEDDIAADYSSSIHQSPMFDLSRMSVGQVDKFLMQYSIKLNLLGYNMVSNYHGTLQNTLALVEEADDFTAEEFADRELAEMLEPENQAEINEVEVGRYSLSAQRERVTKTQLSDLSDYFMMPLEKAAKQLNLCPTAVKKICRRSGLNRWPNRKVKSIVNRISFLKKTFESGDAETRNHARAEMSRLHEEMVQCCGGITPTGIDWSDI